MRDEKLILFDWGHVIQDGNSVKYNLEDARRNICINIDSSKIDELLKIFDLEEFWILNGKELEEFINKKLNEIGVFIKYQKFRELYLKYNENVPYFKEIIDLINLLIKNNCCVGILSNISEFDVIQLNKHLNLDKMSYLFFSSFLKVNKPKDKIYEIVLETTKLLPKNILFIDNTKENIDTAEKMGFCTCLAAGEEYDKIKQNINKFLNEDSEVV